jgi:uncharacterized protein
MPIEIRSTDRIASLDADQWDRLAHPDFPFHRHAFLLTLEETGSVGPGTGWAARHLTAWKKGELVGALPCYEKDHSYGEYVFDWEWARAYHQHGLRYYPKFLAAVPFTPATGPKILLAPAIDEKKCRTALIDALVEKVSSERASSAHALYLSPEEAPAFEARGFLLRHTFQFHWQNRGYQNFEAFLAALKPRKRKQIVRERKQLSEEGLEIRWLGGPELTAAHGSFLYECYLSTVTKMGGAPYLAPDFYPKIFG